MAKNLEVEIRGKLSKNDFKRIAKLLKIKGNLQKHYLRLSVDLSPGFNLQRQALLHWAYDSRKI